MEWHGYSSEQLVLKNYLEHHGIKGQKWGIKNGPPYPLKGVRIATAKNIVTEIGNKVKKDRRPPTGNQNCKICTLCAEAKFRGIGNSDPRPVYSPRDPEFEIEGPDFFKNPKYVTSKNFKDLENYLGSIEGSARFYQHVNWNGSEGGHEFLLLKDDKDLYIMDPQDGTIEPLKEKSTYFADINYKNSYTVRLDNLKFDEQKFHAINNQKAIPFNHILDIPYMYKEGIINKKEYEYAMKHPEEFDADKALLEET